MCNLSLLVHSCSQLCYTAHGDRANCIKCTFVTQHKFSVASLCLSGCTSLCRTGNTWTEGASLPQFPKNSLLVSAL